MTNLNDITHVDWQYKLNDIGSVAEGVDDINQCIAVILTTRKGSVPHRPTFGSNIYKYLDYPIKEATPNITREATNALQQWETRIKIKSISNEINGTQIVIKVEWTLNTSNKTRTTTVTL